MKLRTLHEEVQDKGAVLRRGLRLQALPQRSQGRIILSPLNYFPSNRACADLALENGNRCDIDLGYVLQNSLEVDLLDRHEIPRNEIKKVGAPCSFVISLLGFSICLFVFLVQFFCIFLHAVFIFFSNRTYTV